VARKTEQLSFFFLEPQLSGLVGAPKDCRKFKLTEKLLKEMKSTDYWSFQLDFSPWFPAHLARSSPWTATSLWSSSTWRAKPPERHSFLPLLTPTSRSICSRFLLHAVNESSRASETLREKAATFPAQALFMPGLLSQNNKARLIEVRPPICDKLRVVRVLYGWVLIVRETKLTGFKPNCCWAKCQWQQRAFSSSFTIVALLETSAKS